MILFTFNLINLAPNAVANKALPRTTMQHCKAIPIIIYKFVLFTILKEQLIFTANANNLLNAATYKAVALICG
jgi:hypothetical protein